MDCFFCEEPIEEWDALYRFADGLATHRNCFLRQVVGSVAHQMQTCSCYVKGSTLGDPPGMTKRQAADAAVGMWERMEKEQTAEVIQ